MTTVAITAHRPNRLGPESIIKQSIQQAYIDLGVTKVIQGCAAGGDLLAASVAAEMGIPYIAARPWAGHSPREEDKQDYLEMLQYAERIVDVDPSNVYRGPTVYHERNRWMCNNAQALVAIFDGIPRGGAFQTVKYAQSKGWSLGKEIYWIDAMTGKRRA